MATSPVMAQEIILCDLCDQRSVLLHCNICEVNLCEECVGKHYMSSSASHDIVKYHSKKVHFVYPYCEIHNTEKCGAHCQNCDTPVCMKCLTGSHKGHGAIDLSDNAVTKTQQLERHTASLENMITQFGQADSQIESKIADLISRCDELQTTVTEQGKECHRVIDNFMKKKREDIAKMKEDAIQILRKYQNANKGALHNLKEIVQQNKKILQSANVKEINQYKFKSEKSYQNMLVNVEVRLPNFVSKKMDLNQICGMFGELTGPEILIKPNQEACPSLTVGKNLLAEAVELRRFCTGIHRLHRLACPDTEEVWISRKNSGIIERINIQGSPLESIISSCKGWDGHPSDITTTSEGELLYTDQKNGVVNVVRNGKSVQIIKVPKGWEPAGVCTTKSGNLLVSLLAMNLEIYKIVRYEDKKIIQEIQEDHHGNPLFEGGSLMLFVVENINGDICASNCNADSVTVVDKNGGLRYQYKGQQTMKKTFRPSTIVTDSAGRILLEDFGNECIHIIDQDGKFLRSLDYCGRLSVDKLGQLWVGDFDSGDVKVIKYTE